MSTLRTLICMMFVSLWFVGCQKPLSKKQILKPAVNDTSTQVVEELQAKLYDIPFPIDAHEIKLISHAEDLPQTCALSCSTTTSSQDDLEELYHSEMERLGWKELSFVSTENETVAFFQKPTRSATVVVQRAHAQNAVKIFVQQSDQQA